jgi:hypothetical protein
MGLSIRFGRLRILLSLLTPLVGLLVGRSGLLALGGLATFLAGEARRREQVGEQL